MTDTTIPPPGPSWIDKIITWANSLSLPALALLSFGAGLLVGLIL